MNKGNILPDTYVIFDLETTGFSPQYAEIIEIGALRIENSEITERFHTYVKPFGKIPGEITSITGISDIQTKNAPRIDEAIVRFAGFIKNDVLIAHNAQFDCRFIGSVCGMLGINLTNRVFDSLQMARRYIKDVENHKLETLKKYFKMELASHNAVDDCTVTYRVVEYCRSRARLSS